MTWRAEHADDGAWRVTNGSAVLSTDDRHHAESLAAHLNRTGWPDPGPSLDATELQRQWAWSKDTFGPQTPAGVIDHLRKEIEELSATPEDLGEWVDVIRLGLDGACRSGNTPSAVLAALVAKQRVNEQRDWPDWRTLDPDKAVEHRRDQDRSRVPWLGWRDLQDRKLAAHPTAPRAVCPACGEPVVEAVAVFHIEQEHPEVADSIRSSAADPPR